MSLLLRDRSLPGGMLMLDICGGTSVFLFLFSVLPLLFPLFSLYIFWEGGVQLP
jgi:hypothetical protein